MNKIDTHCLLCAKLLKDPISWTTLLAKRFQPTICEKCSERFENSQSATALYQYNNAMKEYLHQYKFLQDVALAKVFRQELYNRFKREKATIIPIPMHLLLDKIAGPPACVPLYFWHFAFQLSFFLIVDYTGYSQLLIAPPYARRYALFV